MVKGCNTISIAYYKHVVMYYDLYNVLSCIVTFSLPFFPPHWKHSTEFGGPHPHHHWPADRRVRDYVLFTSFPLTHLSWFYSNIITLKDWICVAAWENSSHSAVLTFPTRKLDSFSTLMPVWRFGWIMDAHAFQTIFLYVETFIMQAMSGENKTCFQHDNQS